MNIRKQIRENQRRVAAERAATKQARANAGNAGREFDAEAGRDVVEELRYIRSGNEKRNMGC